MGRYPCWKPGHPLVLSGLTVTLSALGGLGILTALAPRSPAVLREESAANPLTPYTGFRVDQLRARVRAAPAEAEPRVKLALAYATRAAVCAHQEYSAAFPDAFQRGDVPPSHFECWRRGWYRRDPHGDVRQAIAHARRALRSRPSVALRLTALRLIAHLLRQQSRDAAAIGPLREIVAIEPRDRVAWLHLCQIYRSLGDPPHLRAAQRRLEALDATVDDWPCPRLPDSGWKLMFAL